ncbi:MAG: hypothetical protein EP335_09440 [Alphaproteobacteria bacterium]|nr:MAG: hypothetical protein EP335_09440 [Alphaproteobacteria bacterium]
MNNDTNAALLRASESHQFETYWRSIWPRTGMPTSDRIDWDTLGPLKDFVIEGRFTPGPDATMINTFVGRGITDGLNADVTGQEYFATVRDQDRALIIRVFEAMVAQPCGRWRIMHYTFERGVQIPMDTTFFPFRDVATGGIGIGALILPLDDAAPSKMAGRVTGASAGTAAQWINMGAGIPADAMLV